ncbi:MAG TPA: hypothetical protein VFJ85_01320 [Acidimicrobiales bacterium]|nr:hypothetical protein [Acidimicrobiales bacterium]
MGFKEDADFARFVSMGAVGTAQVGRDLRDRFGHAPVELERYAMSNKVWQTKVKRLRLPDLVCLRCGRRIESRAKSTLGVILSHSDTPGREWNAGGMRGDDLYAFVRVDRSTDPPTTGPVAYFSAGALEATEDLARRSARKAVAEGSEVTLTWPSWVPARSGILVGEDERGRLVCRYDDGGTQAYWQWRSWARRMVYLAPGDRFEAGCCVVAGVVDSPATIACPGPTWDVAADLAAARHGDRYVAVKAAGFQGRHDLVPALRAVAGDPGADWRIALEARASLARIDPDAETGHIAAVARDPLGGAEERMEAVLVLSEIPTDPAALVLAAVAGDAGAPEELRAAAVWGLGQGSHDRPDLLLNLLVDDSELVRLHAVVAVRSLAPAMEVDLVGWLGGDDRHASAACTLLYRHRGIGALLAALDRGPRERLWALRTLGDLPADEVLARAGGALPADVEAALTPLWLGQADWFRSHGQEGLAALEVQKVRFDPVTLEEPP